MYRGLTGNQAGKTNRAGVEHTRTYSSFSKQMYNLTFNESTSTGSIL
jgi:hypothetical protein